MKISPINDEAICNTTLQTPNDLTRVKLDKKQDVVDLLYWTKKFGCSEQELKKAIITVTNEVKLIEWFFRNCPPRGN